jgi:hypothetical protein
MYFLAGWGMEQYYNDFLNANFPLGIQLGHGDIHWATEETEHDMSLNITGQSPSGFYSVVNGLGNSPNNILYQNTALNQYILIAMRQPILCPNHFKFLNLGTNTITYPNTSLSNQLKTVAQVFQADSKQKNLLSKSGWI